MEINETQEYKSSIYNACEVAKNISRSLDVLSNDFSIDLDKAIAFIEKEKKCSIKVLHINFDSFSSELGIDQIKEADGFLFTEYSNNKNINIIGVNKDYLNNDAYFSRFIIAHELGHICLSHHDKPGLHISAHIKSFVDFDSSSDSLENEANVFALCLLVPAELLSLCKSDSAINNISKILKVPSIIVQKRLKLYGQKGVWF